MGECMARVWGFVGCGDLIDCFRLVVKIMVLCVVTGLWVVAARAFYLLIDEIVRDDTDGPSGGGYAV